VKTPPSPHFSAVSLADAFNERRADLPERLSVPAHGEHLFGEQTIRGIPFLFGAEGGKNVVSLAQEPVAIEAGGWHSRWIVFVHAVQDAADMRRIVYAGDEGYGYRLGSHVSDYELEYEDGSTHTVPILRRFAIQQARYSWGSAPFACVPALDDVVTPAAEDALLTGEPLRSSPYALTATRAVAAHGLGISRADPVGLLWLYALANPRPDSPLRRIVLNPRDEPSAVYAVTLGDVVEHPLRPGGRRKLRLRLPDGVELNPAGEVDDADIGVDLGVVISARAALDYDPIRWLGKVPLAEGERSERDVVVEVATHPQARLHLGSEVIDLASPGVRFAPAERPVTLRFRDRETREPVAVRLHLHGAFGEYLPPRGHHRKVNRVWHQDNYAELAMNENQYAYVDGECVVDLPLGDVYLEITRGYEIEPIRRCVSVEAETEELAFELDRVLRWRERGWVTADTHVHFLSPQTALLEGKAEDVNVVNLLASQWGEMYSNVGDFDGKTTFGARDLGGSGEFLVRVGSENRMPVLGHISLLGYGVV
jgi:hypothetical protein